MKRTFTYLLASLFTLALIATVGCGGNGADEASDSGSAVDGSLDAESGDGTSPAAEADLEPQETPTPTITLQEVIVTRIVEYEAPAVVTPLAEEDLTVFDIGVVGKDVETFDPKNGESQNELDLINNLFVGLTRLNQLTNQIEPQLARSWERSNDGRTWTFKLRDDVYWIEVRPGGGVLNVLPNNVTGDVIEPIRPVYAEDIVLAVWRACSPDSLSPDIFPLFIITGCRDVYDRNVVSDLDYSRIGVRALDPFTVQFDLEAPSTYFLTITSLPIMKAVPADIVIETENSEDGFDDWSLPPDNIFVSSGPFLLSPISTLGTRIVLEKNPYWPLAQTGDVDLVNFYQFEESIEAYDLWEDRSLDYAPLPAINRELVFDNSPLKVTKVTEPSIFYLAFNHESEVFSQPALRRAFAAAIDREEIIEQVFNELGVPARHLSPPGVFGSPPVDQVGVGYNPDYARLQLIQGGVTACRFLPQIRYMVNSSDAALFQAELVREMWVEELGCPEELIVIEQVPFGELLAATHENAGELRPDIWDLGWEGDYPDAHNWLTQILHCEQSDRRLRRGCDVIDNDLLISAVLSENERPSAYVSIENRLFGEDGSMPVAPIYVSANYFMRQTWVDIRPSLGLEGVYHYSYLPLDAFFVDADLKEIERGQTN